jgi:hypothetical protein
MRAVSRTSRNAASPARVALAMVVVLLGLAGVGVLLRGGLLTGAHGILSSVGAGTRYAALPDMTVSLGGGDGRAVDMKVQLELEPSVEKLEINDVASSRIADRVGDRMRDVDPDTLAGAGGAQLVKSAVIGAVRQEVGDGKVHAVLLESLIVR